MHREYLMLAQPYKEERHNPSGKFVSIKLDGQRCFWDGGISIGHMKCEVPWANLARDTKKEKTMFCTGLWSRYGNIIHAPDWFIEKLPQGIMLDGELWGGRGTFQQTRSAVSKDVPIWDEWRKVQYHVFEMPSKRTFFSFGVVTATNCKVTFDEKSCVDFEANRVKQQGVPYFKDMLPKLMALPFNEILRPVEQTQLPTSIVLSKKILAELLKEELAQGGEGLMLRDGKSYWVPNRVDTLLKVKPHDTDAAIITGFIAGDGRNIGALGAIRVVWNGKSFKINIPEDADRILTPDGVEWARRNIKEVTTNDVSAVFKIGQTIMFRYTSLTDTGLPREGRYYGKGE